MSGNPSTDPRSLPADVKRKLLAARDALIEGDAMEAYHQIYSIAAPHFDKLADEVWTGLESPSPEPGGSDDMRRALEQIKGMVCGDAKPRWDNSMETTGSRGLIADICDLALRTSK